jgi:hypothetical protein
VDGARWCPPEDCGGSCGYADLLDILSSPRHKEYRHMRAWAGEHFDPERFSAPQPLKLSSSEDAHSLLVKGRLDPLSG